MNNNNKNIRHKCKLIGWNKFGMNGMASMSVNCATVTCHSSCCSLSINNRLSVFLMIPSNTSPPTNAADIDELLLPQICLY